MDYTITTNISDHPTLSYNEAPVKRRLRVKSMGIDWELKVVSITVIMEYIDNNGDPIGELSPIGRRLPATDTDIVQDDQGHDTTFWELLMANTLRPTVVKDLIIYYLNINANKFD